MTELNEPRLLAEWLDANPGEAPPEGVEAEVIEAVYALRPDLAPAPRVSLDDILAGVATGPFARSGPPVQDQPDAAAPAFGGALGSAWGEDLGFQLTATYGQREDEQDAEQAAEPIELQHDQAEPTGELPLGDLDEVSPPVADPMELEATPVLGVTGTDPLGEPIEEATDPGLAPIADSLEGESTNPSGRAPAFGVVDAPRPPELAPAEPPPSLRNRAVTGPPQDVGPLSSAGMPTNPPPLVLETSGRTDAVQADTDPGSAEDPETTGDVVDLTAHPRWGGRRWWGLAGSAAAAALVLFVVVPSSTLQDQAQAPGRMAPAAVPMAEQASAEEPVEETSGDLLQKRVAEGFQPNQRLDAPTRASSGSAGAPPPPPAPLESKAKDSDTRSAKAAGGPSPATASPAAPLSLAEPEPEPQPFGGASTAALQAPDQSPVAAADDDWDDVPADAFHDVADEEDAMPYALERDEAPPQLAADEPSSGDWGVAASRSAPSNRERRKSERSESMSTVEGIELEGGLGTLKESNPGTGPEAPPPHEMDALRRDARPPDYRSDWYLMGAGLSDATLEQIRKNLQEADADARADDNARAAAVVARLIDHRDTRVGQDFAGRAAAYYLEAGDPAAAITVIGLGKARGSANTAQLARLHYLEGKALEAQRKDGWAAESYRAAKHLNDAR